MLGPKATSLSAPGIRCSSQPQSRLDGAGVVPQGPDGPAGSRPRQVRFSLGAPAQEGLPAADRGRVPGGPGAFDEQPLPAHEVGLFRA
eukprot:6022856-Alexandrium_andersonii.AAC.1